MKNLFYALLFVIMAACQSAHAYQIYQGPPAGKYSDTTVEVNPTTGAPTLKQDLINNINSGQTNRTFGYMFGRNAAVQNVKCDLWEGPTCTYVFPTVAQQMAVSSSNAADTSAGTGCQQVEIHYLNNLYASVVIQVTMNGVTPVNTTPTNILRVNSFHCIAVGSGGVPAGNISLKDIGATVTYSYMSAGGNYARQAIFTVPAANYGYISHWQASMGAASGSHFTQIEITATQHDGNYAAGVFLPVDTVGLLNNAIAITLPIPIRIPPTTDVKMNAISDAGAANAVVTGAVMGWFEAQ